MRSPFFEGLLYLDLLEIYGSSRLVGELCHLSQSNVYRGAMGLAESLDLAFEKRCGRYGCRRNGDVVARLREAARLLRARGGQALRFLADYRTPTLRQPLADGLWALPQIWLGPRYSLQCLDAGLLDLLLIRSAELSCLLGFAPASLRVGQWLFTPSYALLPLNTESVQLYVSGDHPLRRFAGLCPAQIAAFPSPAFAEDVFPGLNERFRPHGLWNCRIRSRVMAPGLWESFALNGTMVVPSTPNAVSAASQINTGTLQPLDYTTGLVDHDCLVLPITLLDEPVIQQVVAAIAATYHLSPPPLRACGGVSHSLLGPVAVVQHQSA